jgi:hypothetical protein
MWKRFIAPLLTAQTPQALTAAAALAIAGELLTVAAAQDRTKT